MRRIEYPTGSTLARFERPYWGSFSRSDIGRKLNRGCDTGVDLSRPEVALDVCAAYRLAPTDRKAPLRGLEFGEA